MQLLQQQAEIDVCVSVVRLEDKRTLVMLERAHGVAALGEADGEVVVRRGVGGIFLDRRLVMEDGLVEPAEALKGQCKIEACR